MTRGTDLPHQPETLQQPSPMEENKSHRWKYFFVTLSVLNLVGFIPLILMIVFQILGLTSFVQGLLFVMSFGFFYLFFMYALPLSLINFISLSIFLIKHHLNGKPKIIAYAFFVSSGCILAIISIIGIPIYASLAKDLLSRMSIKEAQGAYITVGQAAKMLTSCTIEEVVYFSPVDGPYYNYNAPTGAPTGVILWPKEKPREIYIKKEDLDLKVATLPIVRKAKKKCPNLEIHGIRDL
jgi:hypothetical protein